METPLKNSYIERNIRDELIEIQKSIYRENERKIKELHVPSTKWTKQDIQKYEEDYAESVNVSYIPSNIKELKKMMSSSQIIIVGDYHTLNLSQKTFYKLLRICGSKRILIALEFVLGRHQKAIDKYLQGKITEKKFLKKIEYKKIWEYDIWSNFKPIFDYAKKYKIPVIGIDCMPPECETLYGRDSYAAWRIIENWIKDQKRKIFVLIGESHTAECHLPKVIEDNLVKMGKKIKILVIHQNIENIYWDLFKKGLEKGVEIVKLSDGRFCIINAPPIIVQQSFLNWLEYETETLEYSNLENNFKKIVKHLCKFLNISINEKLQNLTVYGPGDFAFLDIIKKAMDEEEFNELMKNILNGESAHIPETEIVYLGSLSLNHAGEEASHFIKIALTGYEIAKDPEDLFYSRILHEAIGFFGSKVINPKRKTHHVAFFQKIYKDENSPEDEKKLAELVLLHKKWERRKKWEPGFLKFCIDEPEIFYRVFHILGYILGDLLYYGLLEGKIKIKEIRALYEENFEKEGVAEELYLNLIKKLRNVKIPKRLYW